MEGFIVLDYLPEVPSAIKELAVWVSQGKVKSKNTVIKGGLAKAEQALVDMFKGANTGKNFEPIPKNLQTLLVSRELTQYIRQTCR